MELQSPMHTSKVAVSREGKMKSSAQSVIDAGDMDENTVLKRYDQVFRILIEEKGYPMDGKCTQATALDWAVSYALQGSEYVQEVLNMLNYTVLHAALLLTISMPSFIDPPDFRSSSIGHGFMALMGISSIMNLFSILSATAFISILQRPYGSVDSFIARLDDILLIFAVVFDYVGVLTLLIALLIAGFNRDNLDGYVQLYSIGLVIFLSVAWALTGKHGDMAQLKRVESFKAKYCDNDGQLKDEYLRAINPPDDLQSLLKGIGCESLTDTFVAAGFDAEGTDLDAVVLLTREDLIDIGVSNITDRVKLLAEFDRVKNI